LAAWVPGVESGDPSAIKTVKIAKIADDRKAAFMVCP
jgi:hypothetical protein